MAEPLRFELIGKPVGHSLSPQLHGLIAKEAGFTCQYDLLELEPEQVRGYVLALPASGLSGVNVTIPHKLEAYASVGELAATAQAVGAVNTIAIHDGRTVGHNTDYDGFGAMLAAAGIPAEGRPATVLGSGGSARAAVAWLADHGCDVTVISRGAGTLPGARSAGYDALPGGHLLVNATPVGMYPHGDACPLPEREIARYETVADLIYNPLETVLLRRAAALGLRCADGLVMLVAQAVRAQEIWQGKSFGANLIRPVHARLRALREARP